MCPRGTERCFPADSRENDVCGRAAKRSQTQAASKGAFLILLDPRRGLSNQPSILPYVCAERNLVYGKAVTSLCAALIVCRRQLRFVSAGNRTMFPCPQQGKRCLLQSRKTLLCPRGHKHIKRKQALWLAFFLWLRGRDLNLATFGLWARRADRTAPPRDGNVIYNTLFLLALSRGILIFL